METIIQTENVYYIICYNIMHLGYKKHNKSKIGNLEEINIRPTFPTQTIKLHVKNIKWMELAANLSDKIVQKCHPK